MKTLVSVHKSEKGNSANFLLLFNKEELKLYSQIPDSIDFVDNPLFHLPIADKNFSVASDKDFGICEWRGPFSALQEKDINSLSIRKTKVLSRDEEKDLFLRYNYARYCLNSLTVIQKKRPSAKRARNMIFLHQRICWLLRVIINANMGLVMSVFKKSEVADVDFHASISEGIYALLKSTNRFDASKGFTFSTYVYRSILRGFNRGVQGTEAYYRRFPAEFNPVTMAGGHADHRDEIEIQELIGALRKFIFSRNNGLSSVEKKVICEHYGVFAKKSKTLEEIGEELGLTRERVRQIELKAFKKIKQIFGARHS